MENHNFLMGKLTINFTAIFNSYVKLPEGNQTWQWECPLQTKASSLAMFLARKVIELNG
jgi:hypothetical protein